MAATLNFLVNIIFSLALFYHLILRLVVHIVFLSSRSSRVNRLRTDWNLEDASTPSTCTFVKPMISRIY